MSEARTKMEFNVLAYRQDAHGSVAEYKNAMLVLDTDPAGRNDALNPAELLLAALSACKLKSIERMIPILKFQLHGLDIIDCFFNESASMLPALKTTT